MNLEILLEAALFLEQQTSGEEPKKCRNLSDDALEHRKISTSTPTAPPSAYKSPANGNYYADERSRSPSAAVREYYSHSQQPWDSSAGYGNGGSTSRGYASDSGVQSFRVDDLSSRTHRLEEALLRASKRSSPGPSGSGFSSQNGPRSSPDELTELRKRGGAGTREVHNKLEKNRRAHLRECFEFLRKQLPAVDDKKLSNLGILKNALRYIQNLKRKEREFEHTMERLAREKISLQQRVASLKKEVSTIPGYTADAAALDLGSVIPVLHSQNLAGTESSPLTYTNLQLHNAKYGNHPALQQQELDRESCSTSTASEQGENDTEQGQPAFTAGVKRTFSEINGQQLHLKQHSTYNRDTLNGSNSSVTPAYVTLATSQEGRASEAATSIFVRQPVTLANGLSSHVQLTPQIISTQAGMQLIGSPLKVALQPLVAVHSQGGKTINEEIAAASLLNVSATSGAGICIPAGVVIPGLVTLSPEATSADSRLTQVHSSQHLRGLPSTAAVAATHSGVSSTSAISNLTAETVMSLSNGIIKTSATRTLPLSTPSSAAAVGHVMTSMGRSVPIVTSVAVMPPNKHVTHILANTSLDKVMTGPLIKTGSIPIISGQYLTSSQLTSGRHVIKPLVVVAATPPPSTGAAPPTRGDTPPS